VITIRRARSADAPAIGAVHVAAWRSTYPGMLPDGYLAHMSVTRQAAHYDSAIRNGLGVHVATASGLDLDPGPGSAGRPARVVGFVTAGPARELAAGPRLGDGEIETLYVLDDWRDRGLGRRLMRAAVTHLAAAGCRSAFVWVLRENPSRWFYERLGGRAAAQSTVRVGGTELIQTAYVWAPIEKLVEAASSAS
jgi:ribosomal protein S18 acetylase RimI-like enzyme